VRSFLQTRLPHAWIYVDIASSGILGLTTIALLLALFRQRWTSVGLSQTPAASAVGWGLLATLPCYAFGAIAQLVTFAVLRQNPQAMAEQKVKGLELLAHVPFSLMLPLALFAGVYEEILFRGLLLSRLTTLLHLPRLGRRGAAVLAAFASSLLFSLGHAYQGVPGMVQTFAVGAVLCAVALWRKNLWACIVAHAAIDTFGLFALRVLVPLLQQALKTVSGVDAGTP